LTSSISRQNLTGVIPTEKLDNRKKECHLTEARELFLIPRLTQTIKVRGLENESQKREKKLSFCERHGNQVWKKEKITFYKSFIDYKE
jgi:hypothetical protein